jgi:hypothetical protein
MLDKIKNLGSCVCGSRKVRNVLGFTETEAAVLANWDIDPKWMRLFENVDDSGVGPRP